jgi:hypothetical protein
MKILHILLSIIISQVATAQFNPNALTGKAKLLEHIKKEKLRPAKPIAELQAILQSSTTEATKKVRAGDVRLSTTSSSEEGECYLSINHKNPLQMVASYMDNTSSGAIIYPVYYSGDGGNTWQKSSFNTFTNLSQDLPSYNFAGGGDPVLQYDNNGRLVFSWIYLSINNSFDTAIARMYLAFSSNNGATFTIPTNASDKYIASCKLDPNTFESFWGEPGFHDRQWMAIDKSNGPNAGNIYCSFVYFNSPSESSLATGSYVKVLKPGASGFEPDKYQVASGPYQFNNVAVNGNGVVHVTGAHTDNNNLIHCKSFDGGKTWGAPTVIYTGTNLFGNQGSGYIHDRENAACNMVVDGSDNIHIVWSDFPVNPGSNFKSYYSRSTNNGNTFSTAKDLTTLFNGSSKVFMPVVGAAVNRLSIGAYVFRASTGKRSVFSNIVSEDFGFSWGFPKLISSDSTNHASTSNSNAWFGDYSNCVRTLNDVYHIWSDGRSNNGPKVYIVKQAQLPLSVDEFTAINGSYQLNTMYPNPVVNTLNLNIESTTTQKLNVQIFDVAGKLIFSTSSALNIGSNNVQVDASTLAKGNYYIKCTNTAGEQLIRNIQK